METREGKRRGEGKSGEVQSFFKSRKVAPPSLLDPLCIGPFRDHLRSGVFRSAFCMCCEVRTHSGMSLILTFRIPE